jgi:hypothetical protein
MAATHLWMNGIDATLRSCRSAAGSSGTPCVHALTIPPPSVVMTS